MKPGNAKIVLATRQETLDWLAQHDETFNCHESPVKSLWLCEELNRFAADGYVYNREAQERIQHENGLTEAQGQRRNMAKKTRTEGGLLGMLIYYAQGYREEMNLEKGGWIRATQEALSAFIGKKCAAINNGGLGGEIVAKVKQVGERIRLCPLRSRNKAYAEYEDWWIKPCTN
jgi:hypothetical protein